MEKQFSMRSKYHGWCSACKSAIEIGDEITRNEAGKWVHVNCGGDSGSTLADTIQTATEHAEHENRATSTEHEYTPIKDFVPSKYQQAIFDFVTSGTGNAVVEAVAGSGKTTTLVKILDIVPKESRTIFLAFNKHIAVELRKRAPEHVQVSTLHALGYSLIRTMLNNHVELDEDKVGNKMTDIFPVDRETTLSNMRADNFRKRGLMRKLVSLAKATLFNYDDQNEVLAIAERYGIEMNGDGYDVVFQLPIVMQRCLEDTDSIDYDDMIWLPVVHRRLKLFIEKYDFLLVDEAQDLNASQMEYVLNSVMPGGRIIAVGDRNQSLYGFRGADVDAIPRLIKGLNATVLPLSISYRCPASHVKRVKNIVPQIEASPMAIEGVIKKITYRDMIKVVQVGDMVVCRTNAPLVAPAFEVIRSKRKAVIRGRDIGRSLITFVQRFNTENIAELEVLMAEYYAREYDRLISKGKELQAAMLTDKIDTIRTIAAESTSVGDLISKMELLFDDNNVGVVFSSVHRAKGLEAQNVFILAPELMPHPKAKQDWEQQQEMNCVYVAGTRSKENLYLVPGEKLG